MIEDIKSFMKDIEMLNKKLDAQDKIINTQALEIARLKEWKEDLLNENIELENIRKEAIEVLKEIEGCDAYIKEVLTILGEKENE